MEIAASLAENFKMRFGDFHSHATNTYIFENSLPVEISDTRNGNLN
jgi:hypothetical protein